MIDGSKNAWMYVLKTGWMDERKDEWMSEWIPEYIPLDDEFLNI